MTEFRKAGLDAALNLPSDRPHTIVEIKCGRMIVPNNTTNGMRLSEFSGKLGTFPAKLDLQNKSRPTIDGSGKVRLYIFNRQTEYSVETFGQEEMERIAKDAMASHPYFERKPSMRDKPTVYSDDGDDGLEGPIFTWHHETDIETGDHAGEHVKFYVKLFVPNGKLSEENPCWISIHKDRPPRKR